jgi:hypothetical protein
MNFSEMKKKNGQVEWQVRRQVEGQVDGQVEWQVWDQVLRPVMEQVLRQVNRQVEEQVEVHGYMLVRRFIWEQVLIQGYMQLEWFGNRLKGGVSKLMRRLRSRYLKTNLKAGYMGGKKMIEDEDPDYLRIQEENRHTIRMDNEWQEHMFIFVFSIVITLLLL